MTKRILRKGALGGLIGLAAMLVASPVLAQESGAEVWARTCGRCHRLQPPNKYDADSWRAIMGHMALNARLTADEEVAVREFLMGAARPLSMDATTIPESPTLLASTDPSFVPVVITDSGAQLFAKQCAACHGKEGKGDGPAAVALTPRPSDLTDPEVQASFTDAELSEILAKGKGAMPGFSALLKPEELAAVVEYVRTLRAKKEEN